MRKKARVFHVYFRRAGFYDFALRNLFRALLSIAFLIIGFLILKKVIPPDILSNLSLPKTDPLLMFAIFFTSESLLGLLPPDLWIFWSSQFDLFWVMVGLLAILSYLAGIISYKIGVLIGENSFVSKLLAKTFNKYKSKVQKWGGFVIIVAALTPLPFSPISMLAGSVNFRFRNYLLFALTRLPRYFIYAWVIIKFTGL